MSKVPLIRAIAWGLIGGFVATVGMDIVLIVMSLLVGMPPVASLSTVGDTAAGFFSLLRIQMSGGVLLGAQVHYLLGLVLGAIFSVAVTQIEALRLTTIKKGVLLGILYIEVVSQFILAITPLVLPLTASETLQWFGVSAFMHLIWGAILGAVVSYGLRVMYPTSLLVRTSRR